MRNEAPVIVLAEWAAQANAQTRAAMGVSVVPEECREARAYLDGLMTDEEAAACVAADLAAVTNVTAGAAESANNDDAAVTNVTAAEDDYAGLSSSFAAACRAADDRLRNSTVSPIIERERRLLADEVSIERAWRETNHRVAAEGRAAASTVEALMFALREGGTAALQEPKVCGRLAQLSEQQLIEVGDRLQRLKPKIAQAWIPDDVAALISAWEEARS